MYNEYICKQIPKKKQFNYLDHLPTINKIINNMTSSKYEHFSLYDEAFIIFYENIVNIHDNICETPEVLEGDPDTIAFDLKQITSSLKKQKKKKMSIIEILKGCNI
tara:strand:- start:29 stop:346 length:318 start_codon:yes stop_codon:yes gene_type:complete